MLKNNFTKRSKDISFLEVIEVFEKLEKEKSRNKIT